jgi:hypothetical protein
MRNAILAALLLSGGCAATTAQTNAAGPQTLAAGQEAAPKPEAEVQEDESKAEPSDALLAADLDRLAAEARRNITEGEEGGSWAVIAFIDDFRRGRWREARGDLERMPDGVAGNGGDIFEPFLLVAEGSGEFGLERLAHGAGGLPDPYPDIARALILESLGRLDQAAVAYAEVLSTMDLQPGPEGEARDEADLMRALHATRTSQTLYRAALVNLRRDPPISSPISRGSNAARRRSSRPWTPSALSGAGCFICPISCNRRKD